MYTFVLNTSYTCKLYYLTLHYFCICPFEVVTNYPDQFMSYYQNGQTHVVITCHLLTKIRIRYKKRGKKLPLSTQSFFSITDHTQHWTHRIVKISGKSNFHWKRKLGGAYRVAPSPFKIADSTSHLGTQW